MEGAKIALLTMGSFGEVAMEAVDRLRDKGIAVGLLKLRLWRPFPFDAIREVHEGVGDTGGTGPGDLHRRNRRTGMLGD